METDHVRDGNRRCREWETMKSGTGTAEVREHGKNRDMKGRERERNVRRIHLDRCLSCFVISCHFESCLTLSLLLSLSPCHVMSCYFDSCHVLVTLHVSCDSFKIWSEKKTSPEFYLYRRRRWFLPCFCARLDENNANKNGKRVYSKCLFLIWEWQTCIFKVSLSRLKKN